MYISTLDRPELVEPQIHQWWADRLPWFDTRDDLPRIEGGQLPHPQNRQQTISDTSLYACPFCEIACGRRPVHCLHDDKRLFVLLERESLSFGHCMIIPKVHVRKLYELPPTLRQAVFEFATNAASRLEEALAVKAIALVAFGSGLAHAHLHLVPHDDPDVLNHPGQYIRHKTDDELADDARRLAQRVSFAGV